MLKSCETCEHPQRTAIETLWTESERKYHEKRQRELREELYRYHLDMANGLERTAQGLAAEHRAKAEALLRAELAVGGG